MAGPVKTFPPVLNGRFCVPNLTEKARTCIEDINTYTQTERESERERETDRQIDRQTEFTFNAV